MNRIVKKPLSRLGYDFIDDRYIPKGKNEYYLRDQFLENWDQFRSLTASEIEVLVKNNNTSDDWNLIYVSNSFDPNLVKRCNFYGMVRIGALEPYMLEYHSVQLQVGLYDSTIVSCDFGDNVVINNVNHIAHYQIGKESILLNINELVTTNKAKFGNGIIKQDEDEEIRIWIEICNENTGRSILPFEGMLPADAYMWSKYRDDKELMEKFIELTEMKFDKRRGHYGKIGERSIIKNCKTIKDVKIGSDAYIKGANKLKNLTIRSSKEASTQIGEGVELVNGVVGFGCRVFYGSKAVRFIMGAHSSLKYGARLINSYLGNNATISCCEVLNSLIYPGHEQHHNNSFLCAALIGGQSNIAAGATIGSNHNSRGNDGEIIAGRGFWPGLCVSLKHNSTFAPFTLIAKGDYPAEINLPLPFSLLMHSESSNELQVMPAYWMMYNMYALARNAWKYGQRDKRHLKIQLLEFDFLAPDTISEILKSIDLIEEWVGMAIVKDSSQSTEQIKEEGKSALNNESINFKTINVFAQGVENSSRNVRVLKVREAYKSYHDLVTLHAGEQLLNLIEREGLTQISVLKDLLSYFGDGTWINLGGQLVPDYKLESLKDNIKSNIIDSWDKVHSSYSKLGEEYIKDKCNYAVSAYLDLNDLVIEDLNLELVTVILKEAKRVKVAHTDGVYKSRSKDYTNAFRKLPYSSQEEMDAVIGALDGNEFIKIAQLDKDAFLKKIDKTIAILN